MVNIPYSRQEVDSSDIEAVSEALRSDFITQGPCIDEFERAFAAEHRIPHAVAVSNATAGLHIACLALGVGPGSLVWTSPNSFVASSNCALYCGAVVDFVDIDPLTRNMCMQRLEEKLMQSERLGRLPTVVIPVHFAGFSCDMTTLGKLAIRYGFKVLEDASHATGAWFDGAPVGSRYADLSVFSFHAVKIITTGEGGMVATNSAKLDERLRMLRSHGISRDTESFENVSPGPWYYEQQQLGFNYRLTDIHAALGISQLKRISTWRQARERLADRYDQKLKGLPLRTPARPENCISSWHLYAIELGNEAQTVDRGKIFEAMRAAGVGVNVHYIPIHTQPYYQRQGFKAGDFPAAEAYYKRALSLPLYPALTDGQQDCVVDLLEQSIFAVR